MKTIIITGASGNLGRAVTEALLEAGYRVIATVSREASKADLPEHSFLQAEIVNLESEHEVQSFATAMVERYGQIDAAVMLAGGFAMGALADTSAEILQKQISLNFNTAFFLSRVVFGHMIERGKGRIILIGGRPSLKASDGKHLVAYGLSKSLLLKLAEYMNEEAKGKDVTTTVIVPSTIDTPVNRQAMPGTDPGKWVKPTQIADLIEFIISDKSQPLRETVLKVYGNA